MRACVIAAAVTAGLAAMLPTTAGGEIRSSRSWTVIQIHPASPRPGEQIARPGEPLLVHPLTSPSAAILDEDAPGASGLLRKSSWPAGSKLFAVGQGNERYYCTPTGSLDSPGRPGQNACYRDADRDGRFEVVATPQPPVGSISLFMNKLVSPRQLRSPIAYHTVPSDEGPQWAMAFYWTPVKPIAARGTATSPPTMVTITTEVVASDARGWIAFPKDFDLSSGRPIEFTHQEARIAILGFSDDGGLRYRVDHPLEPGSVPLQLVMTTVSR